MHQFSKKRSGRAHLARRIDCKLEKRESKEEERELNLCAQKGAGKSYKWDSNADFQGAAPILVEAQEQATSEARERPAQKESPTSR